MRLRAAAALMEAHEPDRALAALGDLAGSTDPVVALMEARAAGFAYDLERARAALARGLAALDGSAAVDAETEVGLRVDAARIEVESMGAPDAIIAAAREATRFAEERGIARIAARAVLGDAKLLTGDLTGLDDLAMAMAMAGEAGDHAESILIGSRLIFGYLKAGRSADGLALAERLAAIAAAQGFGSWVGQMRYWQAGFAWHGGDFAKAVAVGTDLADGVLSAGSDWYAIQALADLGHLDEARIRAERNLEATVAGEYAIGEDLWVLTDIAFWSGRWADAIAHADRHAREVPNAHHRIFVEVPGAWATVELGRPPSWPASGPSRIPIVEGGAIELEALRALAGGDHADAAASFDTAAAAWAGRHARGELRCRWAAAESLRRAGRAAAATERLLELEGVFGEAGHAPLLARTRRSLRQLGHRRAARKQVVTGSPLTERESEILGLSGRGLRDREIATRLGISRWAVVHAAESAAAKLGTRTRVEAIAVAGVA